MKPHMSTDSTSHDPEEGANFNVLLGGIFLALILWIIGSGFAWKSYEGEVSQAEDHLENLGNRLAYHTSSSIKTVDLAMMRTVTHFSKEWQSLKDNPVMAHDQLATAFAGLQQLKEVHILKAGGESLFIHRFDYSQFKSITDDKFMVRLLRNPKRQLMIGPLQGAHSIGLSRPIYDPLGKLVGYVVAKIDSNYLKKIYTIGLKDHSYRFALYKAESRLLSIPKQQSFDHDISMILSGEKRQLSVNHADRPYDEATLTTHTQVPNFGLVISTELPFEKIIAPWREQTVANAIIGLIFSTIIILSANQVQRTFHAVHSENHMRRQSESNLRKLSQAVEQSPVSVMITNAEAAIEYVNPKFTEISGYSLEEIIGQNPNVLSANIETKTDYSHMWKQLLQGEEWHGEFCNKRKDGSIFWESASLSAIKNTHGQITHFIAVKEDITHRKQAEEQLELAAAVFEAASEAIMVCDENNKIETVNSSFSDITGYTIDEVRGQPPSMLKSGRHKEQFFAQMMEALLKTGRWEGEIWNRRKNGEVYPQWLSIKTIQDDHGKIIRYISLFSDITNRKKDEERILYQANYDALTGLPNRSLFLDRLQRALISAERSHTKIALLFIDLDRFKHVNDTLGHAYGDLLLQEAANRLTSLVRKSDTVARLGGDEFTVIIADLTDFRQVEHLAENLLAKLSAPYDLDNNIAFVSGSIGITIFPNDATNVEDLLKNADTAMYQAKENGRNLSQFFTREMNDEATERRALETALHQALEREEFVLHYQPIVDVQTGNLSSCEVLLRWHQPEYGNVYPDKFIPLAEDTGLIIPIGEWVLQKACREAMIWAKKTDTPPGVSVNMSSRQFQRINVVELVQNTLEMTGLPAERLTLEITESLLIVDDETVIEQLHKVRELGVGLSIDDFGTGYSSLSYLRRFPITTIKIDRSFILDLTSDSEAAAVVSAILSMAQSLNLKVVAEGVEKETQMEQLRKGGCEYIQGYYFSPPVPIEAFRLMVLKEGPMQPDE
ncbi:putative Diguanylate cyclase [Candidatus Terasakiella magnetica]|uniref:Putative Diguanylate cyclase n=1 Tax=Candidatus Terasakiella magnetica TaxID=1867952 RepID=A0A1C3RF85_9PROT|nr:EAL domain-containing protein [Candidatus Terasakiella magnetica]SCA55956.1 putative Diguanylate cyclase [Candidatus Terasakiella magnetica]